jgi:hypothetical protein
MASASIALNVPIPPHPVMASSSACCTESNVLRVGSSNRIFQDVGRFRLAMVADNAICRPRGTRPHAEVFATLPAIQQP